MGDNEKVEPVDDEVLSDNESVDSDDCVPKGCRKLYHFKDGPVKQYITLDWGSRLLTFRANRKSAEKYYETIKSKQKFHSSKLIYWWTPRVKLLLELLLDADAHDLFAVDEDIAYLKAAKGDRRKMNTLELGRAQGFLMAYDLIKWVKTISPDISSSRHF